MTTDRLLLDAMLGKLATYLRMCGYDTAYALDEGIEADDTLLEYVRETDRTLVTRDRQLAARAPSSVLVTAREVDDQLAELADAGLALSMPEEPTRCSVCNARLDEVTRDVSTPDYAPDASERPVWRCRECGQHFWRGSHWDDAAETLDRIPES